MAKRWKIKRIRTRPGDILNHEFLKPLHLTTKAFAKTLKISHDDLKKILKGKAPITPDLAEKLAKRFKTTVQFWINLQTHHDESVAALAHK